MTFRLSSRASALAKAQAYQVERACVEADPSCIIEFQFRESLGDKNLNDPLWKMPEKGVFTEDFYQDLIEDKTDLVVHSWKDLPTFAKSGTRVVATLPRADQRDLLLFKKSSLRREELKLFSSSPRRAQNLPGILSWALPWKTTTMEFLSVRGNVPTRIRKLLQDPTVDGLIVAKAALDRLLTNDPRFRETADFIRSSLEKCNWMVLPLLENPGAAAQGALAIEICPESSQARSLSRIFDQINCATSFASAERERKILNEYGGGCHLALGIAVLQRPYGRIEIVRGLTPSGEVIHRKTFFPSKKPPRLDLTRPSRLTFYSERTLLPFQGLPPANAVFIARAEAWPDHLLDSGQVKWTAGLKTWRKLASRGLWIHGSNEGLGETEDARLEPLLSCNLQWVTLTHDGSAAHDTVSSDSTPHAVYHLKLELKTEHLPLGNVWSWKSASEFILALKKFPVLREHYHVCGPGKTYRAIERQLGNSDRLFVELNDGFSTVV